MVRSKIIKNWVRTHAGSDTQRLSARIRVQINASGAVISKSFAKSSGDAAFDNSAMRAVEQASPLPPPPPEIMAEALREGFVVDFRARIVGSN
jgi:TonB family protein